MGIGQRRRGESCGAREMAACGCGDKVVGFARECDRFQGQQLLQDTRIERKHLYVDPGRIHLRNAPRIEIAQLREDASHPAAGCRNTIEEFAAGTFQKAGRHVMSRKRPDMVWLIVKHG